MFLIGFDYLKSQGFNVKDCLFPSFKASFSKEGFKTLIITKEIIKSQSAIREKIMIYII